MIKHVVLAGIFAAASTSAIAQNANFGHLDGVMEGDHTINLELVRTDSPAVVQIENLRGDVIGMTMVDAGANSDVLVTLGSNGPMNDIIAKIIIDGQVADMRRIQVLMDN
ncbi:MAG: hypothetical protein AAGF13_05405 [Pseudomonadota bacterium]